MANLMRRFVAFQFCRFFLLRFSVAILSDLAIEKLCVPVSSLFVDLSVNPHTLTATAMLGEDL